MNTVERIWDMLHLVTYFLTKKPIIHNCSWTHIVHPLSFICTDIKIDISPWGKLGQWTKIIFLRIGFITTASYRHFFKLQSHDEQLDLYISLEYWFFTVKIIMQGD